MAYDEKIKKKVQILYEKGTTFKEISEQYKISAKTVRQWASKYKWEREKKVLKQNNLELIKVEHLRKIPML